MSTIRKSSDSSVRTNTAGQRVSHGLVALGSAVVLAVYSAGYLRTQAAADRFEDDAAQRRPIVPAPAPAATGAVEAAPPVIPGANEPEPATPAAGSPVAEKTPVPATPAPPPTAPEVVAAKPTAAAAPSTAGMAPVATSKPPATPATSATSLTSATRPEAIAPTGIAAAGGATEPASMVATAGPTATGVADITPSATAAPAAPAAPRYKDGTYTGWGTSRHGDIEAQVIIVNGRITSATIAQCLTRWPCSWIEALPPQVVQRQSPETDFVSGATQSTNAFYYAVVQALGKAALP